MSSLSNNTVLVTGSSGFLGPAICRKLVQCNVTVVGVDQVHRPLSRIHELRDSVKIVTADVTDKALIPQLFREYEIDFVFHLAAQAIVGEAARNPVSTFEDNILGTWNILEACRLYRLENPRFAGVIVASSDKAYGDQENLPYLEDAPMQGRYPYDVSKSCADLIAQSYFKSYGLPVCIARCGNLYGPGDLHLNRIIPGTILSLLRNESPEIRSDGTPVRDYIYVDDAADAYLAIAEAMLTNSAIHGEAFNISNDEPVSVLQVVEALMEVMNKKSVVPAILNTASLEILQQYLSSAKMRTMLGWAPQHTLSQGLEKTIGWYEQQYTERTVVPSLST